jgi:hypothetical protein
MADGLDRQVAVVGAAVADSLPDGPPVQGVLCFTKADLPRLMTQSFRGHLLLYQRALRKRLSEAGPLSAEMIKLLGRELAEALAAA